MNDKEKVSLLAAFYEAKRELKQAIQNFEYAFDAYIDVATIDVKAKSMKLDAIIDEMKKAGMR